MSMNIIEDKSFSMHVASGSDANPVWKKLWKLHIQTKIKIFLWWACVDILLTNSKLSQRHIPVNDICVHCSSHGETLNHVHFHCPFVRQVWQEELEVVAVLLWYIWFRRNQKQHEDYTGTPPSLVAEASSYLQTCKAANLDLTGTQPNQLERWRPPTER
ncbi:hypothetical protein ACH5RR_001078 [Cinchona calisaya]|uniref:Reverse transcriptase zinc-binding domain-containing protein n=1 Tax=Cinchona calisaya TaxID=153742 RepID=A0ABD3B2E3_9GENT